MSRISSMARFRKNEAITDNDDRRRSRSTNRLLDSITKRTNFFTRLVTFSVRFNFCTLLLNTIFLHSKRASFIFFLS